jgi:hypothetical protein
MYIHKNTAAALMMSQVIPRAKRPIPTIPEKRIIKRIKKAAVSQDASSLL